eukprot:2948563-Rhodomonas_salina.2
MKVSQLLFAALVAALCVLPAAAFYEEDSNVITLTAEVSSRSHISLHFSNRHECQQGFPMLTVIEVY